MLILKCGAGEEWRRSVGPIMQGIKKYYIQSRRRGISYTQYTEGGLTGLVTSHIGTALCNMSLRERQTEG
jgi:hypothetical protein